MRITSASRPLGGGAFSACNEGNDEQHEEDNKADFRDPHGGAGEDAESEDACDEGDDEESDGVG